MEYKGTLEWRADGIPEKILIGFFEGDYKYQLYTKKEFIFLREAPGPKNVGVTIKHKGTKQTKVGGIVLETYEYEYKDKTFKMAKVQFPAAIMIVPLDKKYITY